MQQVFFISAGREFHSCGPATENILRCISVIPVVVKWLYSFKDGFLQNMTGLCMKYRHLSVYLIFILPIYYFTLNLLKLFASITFHKHMLTTCTSHAHCYSYVRMLVMFIC